MTKIQNTLTTASLIHSLLRKVSQRPECVCVHVWLKLYHLYNYPGDLTASWDRFPSIALCFVSKSCSTSLQFVGCVALTYCETSGCCESIALQMHSWKWCKCIGRYTHTFYKWKQLQKIYISLFLPQGEVQSSYYTLIEQCRFISFPSSLIMPHFVLWSYNKWKTSTDHI